MKRSTQRSKPLIYCMRSLYAEIRLCHYFQSNKIKWSLAYELNIWKNIQTFSINSLKNNSLKLSKRWQRDPERALLKFRQKSHQSLNQTMSLVSKDYTKNICRKRYPPHEDTPRWSSPETILLGNIKLSKCIINPLSFMDGKSMNKT